MAMARREEGLELGDTEEACEPRGPAWLCLWLRHLDRSLHLCEPLLPPQTRKLNVRRAQVHTLER